MANDISVKLALQGEKEYKNALKEIANGQKVMRSELELVQAKFAGQTKSVEALTAKHDVLQRTLYGEKERIETLKQALQNSAAAFGESDSRTQKWQTELNKAEASAARLENQISQTEAQLQALNDEYGGAPQKISAYTSAIEKQNETINDAEGKERVLRSELEKLSAQYEAQGSDVEKLTEKQRVLKETITEQERKIAAMRQALQESREAFGENSAKTQEWKIKLNEAEGQLAKTQNSLKNTTKQVDQTTESGKGLGEILGQISQKFGFTLPGEMTKSLDSLGNFNVASAATVGAIIALVSAIVDIEKKLINLTKAEAAAADELLTTADITGISTERLQEYAYAAEFVDTSVETITGAQTRLIRSMEAARSGTEAQQIAFEKLGVSYKNQGGTLRESEAVFWEIIEALGEMESASDRDAIAMELMGKSAQDLNPLIKAGSDRMEELAAEAHNVGYVMSGEQLRALGKVDDATKRYNATVEALRKEIAVEFAPHLESSTEKLSKFVETFSKALKGSGIVEAFGMLLDSVTNIIAPTDELSEKSIPKLEKALRPIAMIVASISGLLEVISANLDFGRMFTDWSGYWERVRNAWGLDPSNNPNSVQRLQQYYKQVDTNRETDARGYGEYYYNGWYYGSKEAALQKMYEDSNPAWTYTFDQWKLDNGYNASGNASWRGGFTWVGENGPELAYLPRGTQIQTAQESRLEGDTYIDIRIDASSVREFNDIVRIMENARIDRRKAGR